MSRRREAVGIWLSHGPADAISTIAASRAVGVGVEANPIVARLLELGDIPTLIGICACVAVAAAIWPAAADALEAPPAVAVGVIALGATVAAVNMVVAL